MPFFVFVFVFYFREFCAKAMFGGATLAQDRDAASNDEGYVSFNFSWLFLFVHFLFIFFCFIHFVPDCLISSVTSSVSSALLYHASFARQLHMHVLQFKKSHFDS